MKLLATLFLIFALFGIGYLAVSIPVRERIAGLFSLDYEIPVAVAKARMVTVGRTFTARGKLEPLRETRVNATIPGIIKEIRYGAGDKVAAGAVVATVEANNLLERLSSQEAAVKEAAASVKRSQEYLSMLEKQLLTARAWYQKNLIARRDVDLAEVAVKTARVQREAAEAALAQRRSMSEQTRGVLSLAPITAPNSGIVTRRWVEPGDQVAEAAPVLSIAQAGKLKVLVNLAGPETEKLRTGMAAQIEAADLPGKEFRGTVTHVQEMANFTGDESAVEIELSNPNGTLRFGMPVSTSLAVDEPRRGLYVPKRALIEIEGTNHLYVVDGDRARRRNVVLGEERDGEIEIVSGLRPGDLVVMGAADRLHDGRRVRASE